MRYSREMPTPPNLLNDDGTASMATNLMLSHHAFRRDLACFAKALDQVARGERSRLEALREEWTSYHAALHGHHLVEDSQMFPAMREVKPALATTFDRLAADHKQIDPLLVRGDRAFAALPEQIAEAQAVVRELAELLAPHLALEEAEVVPLIRDAREFPAPATDAEVELYAQGFAWAQGGIADDVLAQVNAMLPAALVAKLPAAKLAFAARCERVWGTPHSGHSRTPVP